MRLAGPILALDLSTRTGWACGCAGDKPAIGAVRLKQDGEVHGVAAANYLAWMERKLATVRPVLVVKEALLPLGGFRRKNSQEASVKLQIGLHFLCEGLCWRAGVPLVNAWPATVRKHFIGAAHCGSRPETKAEVVRRARMLGLLSSNDDDRADAIALHDWAAAVYGKRAVSTTGELILFGERRR